MKIEKNQTFKHPFLFFLSIEYVMMIEKIYGLYRYFHLKNAGRPKRMGHNTSKSTGAVLCVGETLKSKSRCGRGYVSLSRASIPTSVYCLFYVIIIMIPWM